MAKKVFAAGTGVLEGYMPDGTMLVYANTMTETSAEITSSVEEIRGGKGASLIGKYYHTSNFALTATDALFKLEYLALSFGTEIIESNVENITEEKDVTITASNTITVAGTPVAFGKAGVVGWYKKAGDLGADWELINFTGSTATVSGLSIGDTVCVRYNSIDSAAREIVVPTNIIPSEMKAILRQDLMLGEQGDISTYSKVGELVIEIPRFQLNVDQTLSMNMTGASTTSLSGNALAVTEGAGCENGGYYAFIKEVITGRKFYDGAYDLAIVGSPLVAGDIVMTRMLKKTGAVLLQPSQVTYTVAPANSATINATTGEITNVSASCVVTAKLKDGTDTIPAPYNTLTGVAQIEA